MREWVEREIMPHCFEWEEQKRLPTNIHRKCAEAGWLPGVVGFWPTEFVGNCLPMTSDSIQKLI
jgi:alkylation response protein AidB-like acyl-CoA dehydrogenase